MATSGTTGYDPKNTFINEGQLQYWLKNKVSADLESVPGVGPANKHHFVAVGVMNTHQLIGKYLTMKTTEDVRQHQDAMYNWLKAIGVNAGRNVIVLSLAEKCDLFLDGVYDARVYE